MDLIHLSDEQIQNYLDKNDAAAREIAERHLRQCPYCRRNMHIYQDIYKQLQQDTAPVLSPDFSAVVVRRIKATQSHSSNFWENVFIIFLLVMAVLGGSWLLDPLPVLKSIAGPVYALLSRTLNKIPVHLNGSLILFAAGIFILFFYEFLNNRLLKSRSRRSLAGQSA